MADATGMRLSSVNVKIDLPNTDYFTAHHAVSKHASALLSTYLLDRLSDDRPTIQSVKIERI